jgi:hypothetical protein
MPRTSRLPRFISLAAVAALATTFIPTSAAAQRPAMPRIRPDSCDNYCNEEWASCRRMSLRTTPSENAPVAAVLDSGVRATVLQMQRHNVTPGLVVVRRTFTLDEHAFELKEEANPKPPRWRLRAGDTIYVLDRISDGDGDATYIWTHRGRETETRSFWPSYVADPPKPREPLRLVQHLEQQWWARVKGPAGETGWTLQSQDWSGTNHYDDPAEKCARQPHPWR